MTLVLTERCNYCVVADPEVCTQSAKSSNVGMATWRGCMFLRSCGSLFISPDTCDLYSSLTLPFCPNRSSILTRECTYSPNMWKAFTSPLHMLNPSISSAIHCRANYWGWPSIFSRAVMVLVKGNLELLNYLNYCYKKCFHQFYVVRKNLISELFCCILR